ncbi:hypothetical protein FGO68_gene30 [Halteria grandinella]|uniref:MORN repeat-containing protein n=1 Tax=Halteria grandinella TaxID=5974 RepID=A0A8J8NPE9_HALGN|nr:hypothetical protein FGO68_gene30 [Halteria grandinella]
MSTQSRADTFNHIRVRPTPPFIAIIHSPDEHIEQLRLLLGPFDFGRTPDYYLDKYQERKPPVHTKSYTYDGEYANALKEGRGVLVSRLGSLYEGWFKGDRFHFRGRMIWQDGTVYEGEWEDDRQHGHGVYRLINGNRWEGRFKKGGPVGKGKYVTIDGFEDERNFGENCIIF